MVPPSMQRASQIQTRDLPLQAVIAASVNMPSVLCVAERQGHDVNAVVELRVRPCG